MRADRNETAETTRQSSQLSARRLGARLYDRAGRRLGHRIGGRIRGRAGFLRDVRIGLQITDRGGECITRDYSNWRVLSGVKR